MKSKAIAAILFAGTLAFLAPRPASAAWSVSISYFHQELAPYGRWVSAAAYGEVWYPTVVAAGWQPYLDGEWTYTDYGFPTIHSEGIHSTMAPGRGSIHTAGAGSRDSSGVPRG